MGKDEQERTLIEYLKTIDTPTVSNAIEQLRLRPRSEGAGGLCIRRSLFAVTPTFRSVFEGAHG